MPVNLRPSVKNNIPELLGGIDYPNSPILITDFLVVSGWCLNGEIPTACVTLFDGPGFVGHAKTGMNSALVQLSHESVDRASFAGFQIVVPVNQLLQSGSSSIRLAPRVVCQFEDGRELELRTNPLVVVSRSAVIDRPEQMPALYLSGVTSSDAITDGLISLKGYLFNSSSVPPKYYLCSPRKKVPLIYVNSPSALGPADSWYPVDSAAGSSSFEVKFPGNILGGVPAAVKLVAEIGGGVVELSDRFSAERIRESIAISLGEIRKRSIFSRILAETSFYLNSSLFSAEERSFERAERPTHRKNEILVITHNVSPFEGAPRVLLNLLRELRTNYPGVRISVLSLRGDSPSADVLSAADMFYSAPQPLMPPYDKSKFQEIVNLVDETIDRCSPDLIIANVIDSFPGVYAAKRKGVDVHWMIHESKPPETAFNGSAPAIQQVFLHSLQSADRLLFVSETTADLYRSIRGSRPISVIRNGIDLSRIDGFTNVWTEEQARGELGITNELVVSIIGTVATRKGQDIFVREMALLKTKMNGRRLKCFVVGCRNGEFLDTLRLEIDRLGLDNEIVLVNESHRVGVYLRATDIVCICSREESAPLIALEAMGFGKPIVSTSVFGLSEQLRDQSNALIFDPQTNGDLATKIELIVNEPPLRERLSVAARNTVEESFSFKSQYDGFEQQLRPYLTDRS